ncbi:MAG TPA: MBL fold metallo-hydrolase [Gemmatimonadaceae bacterium]|nr:MBL fold metallo-hydrolase [Gemmatimonadaceae bacterium]
MRFKRFYDENLAQASYMIVCEKTREAIVIDPNVDVQQYVRAAGAQRARITHVTETHIHADFVSGSRALAEAAGATLHLSAEGGEDWGYAPAAMKAANPLRDGTEILMSTVRLRAVHTPGHTPEHLAFLVSDLERGEDPVGILSGDFVFVGDVGRPDLLERTAGAKGSMASCAEELFESIRTFSAQPDHLQIWPGHGAGSACGKSLGSMPQTTLGYERLFNWAFGKLSKTEFVARVLEDQPVPPRYFAVMKRVNRAAELPVKRPAPRQLELEQLETALREKAPVIDTRSAEKFAAEHVPGTMSIPLGKSFLNWTGALVPEERDFYLITEAESDEAANAVVGDLAKIGLTRVAGLFRADVLDDWKSHHGEPEHVPQLDPNQLHDVLRKKKMQVLDVRAPDEWRRGHLPGAIHIPLAALPERIGELDASLPIVLHCKGGGRSSIATSFLQARGVDAVSNLSGGYDAWVAEGFEVET